MFLAGPSLGIFKGGVWDLKLPTKRAWSPYVYWAMVYVACHRHACNDQRSLPKTAGGVGGAVSPPAGPGQKPGGGPGGEAPGSFCDFVIFEALKWLRIL